MAEMLTLECASEEAVIWITESLLRADLQVATSFDLRTARSTHTGCSCPHHGTSDCDCQMVLLLVYGTDAFPATLVVHGRDGQTYLSMADTAEQRPSTKLTAVICSILTIDGFFNYLTSRPTPLAAARD